MLSERFIVSLIHWKLRLSVNIFGIHHQISVLQICIGFISIIAIVSDLYTTITEFYSSIHYIVMIMMAMLYYTTILAFNISHMPKQNDPDTIYRKIEDLDCRLNTNHMQGQDWTLTSLTGLICICAGFIILTAFMAHLDLLDIIMFLVSFDIITWAIYVCIILKRLRHLRIAEQFMNRTEDAISYSRELLRLITKKNDDYGALTTNYAILTFMIIIHITYLSWDMFINNKEVYGVNLEQFPFVLLPMTTFVFITIVMVYWSSTISQQVDEINVEMDISKTARPCTKRQSKQISLFMLELHHSSTELSALDLFDINKSSLSTALATVISYLLVLIQFS